MYIYDVSIRRKPLVCGLHGNQTKKRSSTTNKILKKYENTFSFYDLRKADRKWRSSIGSILVRCKRWNFTRSMVVHCLLLENREEKPQRQAEYDRSCHNYVQCAIKKILECLSNNFRNVIKIKFTCWYLHVHKKFKRNDFSTPLYFLTNYRICSPQQFLGSELCSGFCIMLTLSRFPIYDFPWIHYIVLKIFWR